MRPKGFKIGLEIIYKSKGRVKEVPVVFHERKAGTSKVGFNIRGELKKYKPKPSSQSRHR